MRQLHARQQLHVHAFSGPDVTHAGRSQMYAQVARQNRCDETPRRPKDQRNVHHNTSRARSTAFLNHSWPVAGLGGAWVHTVGSQVHVRGEALPSLAGCGFGWVDTGPMQNPRQAAMGAASTPDWPTDDSRRRPCSARGARALAPCERRDALSCPAGRLGHADRTPYDRRTQSY